MKNVIKGGGIFIITIILLDVVLSIFFEKEMKQSINNKLELTPIKTDPIQIIDWEEVTLENGIPYWESQGNIIDSIKENETACNVIGLGDSVMAGAGVKGKNDFMDQLGDLFSNTNFFNYSIAGATIEQEVISYYKRSIGSQADLLIWEIYEGDFFVYTYVDGILYNSKITVNNGYPYIFTYMPEKLNMFFIDHSYLYNKLIKLFGAHKIRNSLDVSRYDFVLNKMKKVVDDFQDGDINKQVLFAFNIRIGSDKAKWNRDAYDYNYIKENFTNQPGVHFFYFHDIFTKKVIDEVKYDDCCHFNEKGHTIIAEQLHEYIKNNNLLNEECY